MNVVAPGDAAAELPSTFIQKAQHKFEVQFVRLRDKTTPHLYGRWGSTALFFLIYFWRVWMLQGWYIVTYALGIYIVNLLIGFLSPQLDPEQEGSLPTAGNDEFKPFMRRLPEFKFWYSVTKALLIAFACTFFSLFNIPVYWPILLMYFLVLFFMTMRRQIKHMIKYKYIPFTMGKQVYAGKKEGAADASK